MTNPKGFEERKPLDDKDIMMTDADKEKIKQEAEEIAEPEEQQVEKSNASERINLQNIMELREAFDLADLDRGGALELDEFIEAFGEVIGKNMNMKQLK